MKREPTGLICDACGCDDAYWAHMTRRGDFTWRNIPKFCLRCMKEICDGGSEVEEGDAPSKGSTTIPQT